MSQLSQNIIACSSTISYRPSTALPRQRYFRSKNTIPHKKRSPLDAFHHKNWPSFHIPRFHSQRLPPPRSNPFDSFLDNVRKVTGANSSQPDLNTVDNVDSEGNEENTFIKLDPNSTGSVDGNGETTFGPLAMLAVGFLAEEFNALQTLLDEIGADEVTLIPGTEKLIKESTLGEALSLDPPPPHENPLSTNTNINSSISSQQKVIFLSGMYASEVIEVVGAVREYDGVPECAFAAAVPNSWSRLLSELVEDVCADHAAMAERRAQQMAQMEADALSIEFGEE